MNASASISRSGTLKTVSIDDLTSDDLDGAAPTYAGLDFVNARATWLSHGPIVWITLWFANGEQDAQLIYRARRNATGWLCELDSTEHGEGSGLAHLAAHDVLAEAVDPMVRSFQLTAQDTRERFYASLEH